MKKSQLQSSVPTLPAACVGNDADCRQSLINLMPPHEVYIEPFLGSGAVLRRKRPAACSNVGIDCDPRAIAAFSEFRVPSLRLVTGDSRQYLREYFGLSRERSPAFASHVRFMMRAHENHLVYADPPYLGSTRKGRRRYAYELMTETEHIELLRILTSLPAMVMISGYRSELYDRTLRDWRRVEIASMTHGGPRWESVWMNYPEPCELHDYRFLGRDCYDRLRIRRKIARHVGKLRKLPALERAAILKALNAGTGKGSHDAE